MRGSDGRLRALFLALLFIVFVAPASLASHEDGYYEIPGWDMWDKPDLNVIVVPPAHGRIFGSDGFLQTKDPDQLTPFNVYLSAVEDSIKAWDAAVERFGSDHLKEEFDVSVYVLGRDTLPPEALMSPDIVITTSDDSVIGLGFAFRPYPSCFVNNSSLFGIATYTDVFNISGQEYGHCLGVDHVGDQGGVDPTAALQHPEHDIMNGFYTHSVGDETTHRHCISNLDVLALEFVFGHRNTGAIPLFNREFGNLSMPVDDYRTVCDPSGTDPAPRPYEPEPEPEPEPSATPDDPAVVEPTSRITSPTDGKSIPRSQFDLVMGQTDETASGTEIALRRTRDGQCFWWAGTSRHFRAGSCDEPRWVGAGSDPNWAVSIDHTFPGGRYQLRSRAIDERTGYEEARWERARNLVTLRLT